jgi:hypothetical protein
MFVEETIRDAATQPARVRESLFLRASYLLHLMARGEYFL